MLFILQIPYVLFLYRTYRTIPYSAVPYCIIPYTLPYRTVSCRTAAYCTILYRTVPCHTAYGAVKGRDSREPVPTQHWHHCWRQTAVHQSVLAVPRRNTNPSQGMAHSVHRSGLNLECSSQRLPRKTHTASKCFPYIYIYVHMHICSYVHAQTHIRVNTKYIHAARCKYIYSPNSACTTEGFLLGLNSNSPGNQDSWSSA